jgi:hypothetical protein
MNSYRPRRDPDGEGHEGSRNSIAFRKGGERRGRAAQTQSDRFLVAEQLTIFTDIVALSGGFWAGTFVRFADHPLGCRW